MKIFNIIISALFTALLYINYGQLIAFAFGFLYISIIIHEYIIKNAIDKSAKILNNTKDVLKQVSNAVIQQDMYFKQTIDDIIKVLENEK